MKGLCYALAAMFLLLFLAAALLPAQSESSGSVSTIAHWSFEKASPGANSIEGGPDALIEGAEVVKGHEGTALSFHDWSVKNYLKPDPSQATRAVVPDDSSSKGVLNPGLPFRISAWIQPIEDPVYYGGIVEKGHGFGASYRLVLLRGLHLSASIGDRHVTVRSSEPLSIGKWHKVEMMADGKDLVLHVNGKESGRAPLPGNVTMTSQAPLVIGERFSGKIDEVVIDRP